MDAFLSRVERSLKGKLKEEMGHLDFEYEAGDYYYKAKNVLTLSGCDDSISMFITFFSDKSFRISAIFDEIELTLPVARLMNSLMDEEAPEDNLMLYISKKNFLTVERTGTLYDPNYAGEVAFDFMMKLVDLSKKSDFKILTDFTH